MVAPWRPDTVALRVGVGKAAGAHGCPWCPATVALRVEFGKAAGALRRRLVRLRHKALAPAGAIAYKQGDFSRSA